MPQKTKIEWTDYTSNPIRFRHKDTGREGWHCEKVSPGCAACYAEAINRRFGTGLDYTKRSTGLVEPCLNERELAALLKLKGPARVFLGDMTDLFLDAIPDAMLDQVFAYITAAKRATFQILTKRPERARKYFRRRNHWGCAEAFRDLVYGPDSGIELGDGLSHWPPENVWLGVSAENQTQANERIPVLQEIRATVRFLSVEPMLSPIDLERHLASGKIHLVIVGGESGTKARPCNLAWIRSIVQQCKDANVLCFVKQLGAVPVTESVHRAGTTAVVLRDPKGGDMSEWPEDLRVREFPRVEATR